MAFKKGQSGNPNGRPKGVKDRRTKYRDLLEPHAEGLMKKAVDLALGGDTTAMRLCLERVCPAIKAKDEPIKIDGLKGTLAEQGQAIIAALGEGDITPAEAASVLGALSSQARIVEVDELEKRIAALEEKLPK